MFVIIKKHDGKQSVPQSGLQSFRGENKIAFKSRAEALAGADESVTEVFSRHTGLGNGLLAGMWKAALAEDLDTDGACDKFGLPTDFVPAWRSGIEAYYRANPKKTPPERLPVDVDGAGDDDDDIAT